MGPPSCHLSIKRGGGLEKKWARRQDNLKKVPYEAGYSAGVCLKESEPPRTSRKRSAGEAAFREGVRKLSLLDKKVSPTARSPRNQF